MKVSIDLVADAARMQWGDRAGGSSWVMDAPGRGVRLLLDGAGDVVGVEVLGWSRRAVGPSDVEVSVTAVAEVLGEDDPLAIALGAGERPAAVMAVDGLPGDGEGRPMLTLADVAQQVGRDRSWLTRQIHDGRLPAQKIGRNWYISVDTVAGYLQARRAK